MANIKGTCNKDINILARVCVYVCVCVRVRACANARECVCVHGEREACVPASDPREAASSVSLVFITTVSK